MSLDNIQLPVSILQGLYNKSLYDLKTNESETSDQKGDSILFLGSNQKKISILVTSPEAIYLPDDELNFLMGILSACKLSMADIALINTLKNKDLNYAELDKQLQAEKLFLFGVNPDVLKLPLQFPYYQIQHFNNQIYLSSAPLTELQKDKDEKIRLWNCLKNIFSL